MSFRQSHSNRVIFTRRVRLRPPRFLRRNPPHDVPIPVGQVPPETASGRRRTCHRIPALLRLQAELHRHPSLLRSAVSRVRGVQLPQAHRARRPARPRRAADRRAREDRLPGGAQAAARRRAPDRHDALSARLRAALRTRARLRATGAIASRSSVSTCATRRASKRSAASCSRRARGSTSSSTTRARPCGVRRSSTPHDGGRDGGACVDAGPPAKLLGTYEGLRGYSLLPDGLIVGSSGSFERSASLGSGPDARGAAVAGPAAARGAAAQKDLFPEGRLDQDLQQIDLRGPQLVAAAAGRGVVGGAARSAPGQRRRAVHHQRAPQAADAAHARARQAHRQRVGGGRAVLSQLQDDPPSAHEHGEGGAEHDDAHVGGRLSRRRHPHEQRGHRLGHRRRSRARSPRARPPSSASTRRSTSSTAPPASSTRSSTASTPARTSGDSF